MKLLLVFALVCTSLSAMAECYNFEGSGPQKIRKTIFTPTPRTMCLNVTARYSNVELFVGNTRVAVIEADVRRERSPQGEVVADLGMATVTEDGDVFVEDYRGLALTIKRGAKANGSRELTLEGKRYVVSPK